MLKLKGDGGLKQVRRKDGSAIRNSWMLVLNFMDTDTGKRKQKYRSFRGTKKEARRALENFRREMEEGLRFDADTVTFGTYAKQWINARESSGEFAPATIKRNKEVLAHLKRHLESSLIIEIDAPIVRELYIKLADEGVGRETIVKAGNVLGQIMKQAFMDGLIIRNPCDLVKAPHQKKSHVGKALSKTDLTRLLNALTKLENKTYPNARDAQDQKISNRAHAMLVRLIISTGMRQGEALALSWEDIDLRNATLTVRHTLDKVTGKPKEPKTEAGNRTISLDQEIVRKLGSWKSQQRTYLNYLGIEQVEATPVITGKTGEYLKSTNLCRWWRKFREDNKLPDVRLHDIRHSHATYLVSSGLNIKAVSSRLGHASVGITLDLYAHAQREDDMRAADIIDNILATPQSTRDNEGFVEEPSENLGGSTGEVAPILAPNEETGQSEQRSDLRSLGSPYRIRTGDLRLESTLCHQNLGPFM